MAIDSLKILKKQPQDFVSSAQLSQASQKPVAPGPQGCRCRAMGEFMVGSSTLMGYDMNSWR